MSNKTCGNCEFWFRETLTQDGNPVNDGACRAHSPQCLLITQPNGTIQVISQWPMTGRHVWCGDWKLKLETAH